MKKFDRLTTLATLMFTGSLWAADPVWTAVPMSASGDTIRKDGALVYAVAGGHTSGSSIGQITVNGVTFDTIKSLSDYPNSYSLPFSVTPQVPYDASGLGDHGVTSTDYAQMLSKGFWKDAVGEFTFTLKNLEAGSTYLVQLVCHRDTTGYTVVAPDGVATIHTCRGDWTYGGVLNGVFTATNSTVSFTFDYVSSDGGKKAHFNALQVRNLDQQSDPYVAPKFGSSTVNVTGSAATISVTGIELGVGHNGEAANSYSLAYSLNDGPACSLGTALTDSFATIDLPGLADGVYTCLLTMVTDQGETVTNSLSFVVNTSMRWKARPMSETGDTIETRGTLVYAYARVDSTVNGVPFTGLGTVNLDSSSKEGYNKAKFFINKTFYRREPISSAEDDYTQMLENYWHGSVNDDGSAILELKDLRPGSSYLVQIVFSFLESYASGSQVSTPDGKVAKFNGTDWEHGGTLVGLFKAAGTTANFDLSFAKCYCINAIQVRKVQQGTIVILR